MVDVQRRLAVQDGFHAQLAANLKCAARRCQGILKRAFQGRLVPQDPTDELASVLLNRIRAEPMGNDASAAPQARRKVRRSR